MQDSAPADTAVEPSSPVSGLQIEFVSDVVCPWCAIGLNSLLTALQRLGDTLGPVSLSFQPFQLNPQMGPEGEDITEHLSRKYGLTPAQVATNQAQIRERAAAVGFDFRMDRRSRTWNTFEAHRWLHAAALQGPATALALKQGLLAAYFTHGDNPAAPEVLARVATEAGLSAPEQAALAADPQRHAEALRQDLQFWLQAGIQSVPAVVVNRRHLISGGQPPEVFEQALRQIAAGA